jgi:hypothetical protein
MYVCFVAPCYFAHSEEELGNGRSRKLSEKGIIGKGIVAKFRE